MAIYISKEFKLSILYLRCKDYDENAHMGHAVESFNSLFEMPLRLATTPRLTNSSLSILYLRCPSPFLPPRLDRAAAFNSLFEMRTVVVREAQPQRLSFNSLFEMHKNALSIDRGHGL